MNETSEGGHSIQKLGLAEMASLACSFSPQDSTHVHMSYAIVEQLENEDFAGSSLIRDVSSIFGASMKILQDFDGDDVDGDEDNNSSSSKRAVYSLPSIVNDVQLSSSHHEHDLDQLSASSHHPDPENHLSVPHVDPSMIDDHAHTNSLVENDLVFSYAALPRPRFSRCGRFMTCIANNGYDQITLTEMTCLEAVDGGYGGQWAEPVVFDLVGGKQYSLLHENFLASKLNFNFPAF